MDKLQIYAVFMAVVSGMIGGLIAGAQEDYDKRLGTFISVGIYLALLIPIFGRVWGW